MISIVRILRDLGVDCADTQAPFQIKCPFHKAGDEMSPSARVYPESNSFFCFTCHTTYTPVSALAAYHGIEYAEAKGILAETYGVGFKSGRKRTARLDTAVTEVLRCIAQLEEPVKTRALIEADALLVGAARGEGDQSLLQATERFFHKLWPTLG